MYMRINCLDEIYIVVWLARRRQAGSGPFIFLRLPGNRISFCKKFRAGEHHLLPVDREVRITRWLVEISSVWKVGEKCERGAQELPWTNTVLDRILPVYRRAWEIFHPFTWRPLREVFYKSDRILLLCLSTKVSQVVGNHSIIGHFPCKFCNLLRITVFRSVTVICNLSSA